MINKTKIVEEASDETEYWLELWAEAGFISESQITEMDKATDETLRNLKS